MNLRAVAVTAIGAWVLSGACASHEEALSAPGPTTPPTTGAVAPEAPGAGGSLRIDVPTTLLPVKLQLAGITAKLDLKTCTLEISLRSDTVGFALDSAEIGPVGLERLADVADAIAAASDVTIIGHSSSDGEYGHNVRLSKARADAVRAVMAPRLPRATFHVDGRGPDEPIADNGSEAGRVANRRVVVSADVKRERCS